ncbi:nucleoside phosphorylase domain-containing protein [Cytidiella melzeri]|nr:nucleoside phosphorylase domain-containing protein [Cytidiella melzeri]
MAQPNDITLTLDVLASLLPTHLRTPRVGIVCGSGLSKLADSLRDVHEVPYSALHGFGKSTVEGHKSVLAFGVMGEEGVPVVAMLGRFHPYEGHPMATVVYPIRVLARLGVRNLIITNASGGLNPEFSAGTIVVVEDHFALPNLTGTLNPLFGPLYSPSSPRFVPLSDAYSPALRRLAFLAAHSLSFPDSALQEGVYAWVSGPTYETPAEGRFLRAAGADVVGMSTVPEVVAAREAGVEVVVLSLVTNAVEMGSKRRSVKEEVRAELEGKEVCVPQAKVVTHEEVLAMGKQKAEDMRRLVERMVALLHKQ